MKFIQSNAYACYLGVATACCGIHTYDWRFWVIFVPTVLLVAWKCNK
jgi:hypothetical protein